MFFEQNLLTYTLLTPLIGVLISIPVKQNQFIKRIALNTSSFAFIISLLIWTLFENSTSGFQFVVATIWVSFF
jgi:NADH:ubiquinone oxidoreductase subunit 4 (subunit M)